MPGEQSLVGGDDIAPRVERGFARSLRNAVLAAYQLDEYVRFGLARHLGRVVEPRDAAQVEPPVAAAVARRYGSHSDRAAGAAREGLRVVLEQGEHARADRAESGERDGERRHQAWTACFGASTSLSVSARKRRTLRAAWRIRCRFSTSAIRT